MLHPIRMSEEKSFLCDLNSFHHFQLVEEIEAKAKVRDIVHRLYCSEKCTEIVLRQLEEKVTETYNGHWRDLLAEYIIPAESALMQLKASVQVSF